MPKSVGGGKPIVTAACSMFGKPRPAGSLLVRSDHEEFGEDDNSACRGVASPRSGWGGAHIRCKGRRKIWCWNCCERGRRRRGMLLTGLFPGGQAAVRSGEFWKSNASMTCCSAEQHFADAFAAQGHLDAVVNKILADVLTMFDGGRAIESTPNNTYIITYEVTAENVTGNGLMAAFRWTRRLVGTQRIANGQPVIIFA